MKFDEWYEKDGQNFDECVGMTQDERNIAERSWEACKKQCLDILKANLGHRSPSDHEYYDCVDNLIDEIENT